MSVFGDNTLEERILDFCDEEEYSKEEILRALLTVASYINFGYDADKRTPIK